MQAFRQACRNVERCGRRLFYPSERERERELKTYDMLQISWCGMLSVHEFKFV